MTIHRALGLNGSSMRGDSGHLAPGRWFGALALAFAVLALAGCASGGDASRGPVDTQSGRSAGTSASSSAGQTLTDDIPAGRSFAEGGGGPMSYTFREEWRKARAEAQKWRSGAYLITAYGGDVNDVGTCQWTLRFIDKADADAVLLVDIDSWGKVTQTRQVTGDGVISFIDQYTKRMPYAIIDSDKAVELGKAALGSRYNLAKTKDPSLTLNYSRVDGSGPNWTYMLFYNSTAEYVSAQIDALTGEVTPPN